LTGDRVPGSSVDKFLDALRIPAPDFFFSLEFDKTSESVAAKLPEHAAFGAREHVRIDLIHL
jgi:hypothetical protein